VTTMTPYTASGVVTSTGISVWVGVGVGVAVGDAVGVGVTLGVGVVLGVGVFVPVNVTVGVGVGNVATAYSELIVAVGPAADRAFGVDCAQAAMTSPPNIMAPTMRRQPRRVLT
jgi:hypothetical protein